VSVLAGLLLVIAGDRPFKSDCELWRGHEPCAVQRKSGQADCAGCIMYLPATSAAEPRRSSQYDPDVLRSARRICILEAGGLGSVLRTTAVSRAIRFANPAAEISWITHGRGVELLRLVPAVVPIDMDFDVVVRRVVESADVLVNFDLGDDGRHIVPLARTVAGFTVNSLGRFEPASRHAAALQRLQIDDAFRRSSSEPLQKILVGAVGLDGGSARYDLALSSSAAAAGRATLTAYFGGRRPSTVIGLNIGSSIRGRLKRWRPRSWAELAVGLVRRRPNQGVVLLHGPEDRDAREATLDALSALTISAAEAARIRPSGTNQSVVDFLGVIAAVDLVVTADTFALHAAAALAVPLVVVVGPMPHRELELVRNDRVVGPALTCSPCYYRCRQPVAGACMLSLEVTQVLANVGARLDAVERPARSGAPTPGEEHQRSA
jgi:ADP-heptose:LPS heptosyltransferase